MGVISNDAGNYNLGEIKNVSNSFNEDYILYNDADLLVTNNFQCDVDDYDPKFVRDVKEASKNLNHDIGVNSDVATLPVKMYFEADYQMYLDMLILNLVYQKYLLPALVPWLSSNAHIFFP